MSNCGQDPVSPGAAFRMRTRRFRESSDHLGTDRLRVRPVTEGGLNSIRVSFGLCNHDGEVGAFLESLKKLA